MSFRKNHSVELMNDAPLHPTALFVEDFTRLVTDVDRVMGDMCTIAERENIAGRENGSREKHNGNLSVSHLQEHARTFANSLSSLARFHEQIPLPYIEFDDKGKILRSNDECVRMLNGGLPLIGRSLFGFLANADVQRLRDHLAQVRQADKTRHVHLSTIHKGKARPCELWTRRQLLGERIRFVAVIESADESRFSSLPAHHEKTVGPLHELLVDMSSGHTLKSVADIVGNYCRQHFSSPAGMVFIERDGDLQLVSDWYSARLSKKSLGQEMIRKGPVARAFRGRAPILWTREHMPASNASRYLGRLLNSRCPGIVFLPISSPPRRPVGVLAMVLSQTKATPLVVDDVRHLGRTISGSLVRARAYDEALAARIATEKEIRRREEFLSVLSHELKSPMVPILGWAVALGSGTLQADKQNVAIDGIVRNVRSLNYLIDDMFDASRISAGKLRLERVQMRIQEVAREALTAVQVFAEKKKLRMSTDISEAVPPFFADPGRLRQVLVNLLNNAVKFTPEGGTIALKIARRQGFVQFTVSDTGKGIAPKFLPLIFERFQQDYRSSKPREAGLGLGLAIGREIVLLHGGSITAHSEGQDKGATFVVRLPLQKRHC